jgi:glycyl-tRNA synthetase beta chain
VRPLEDVENEYIVAALEERGLPYDVRESALEAQRICDGAAKPRPGWTDPRDCLERAEVLLGFRNDTRFEPLVVLFRRVGNILKAATETLPGSLDRDRLAENAERELLGSLERANGSTRTLWDRRAYPEILPALLELEHPIHDFFDHVMVNVDDLPTRINRLQLLWPVRAISGGWDLSRIVVQGES